MRLDIDRIIQTTAGVSLSCLSVSGLMCINTVCSRGSSSNTPNNEAQTVVQKCGSQ